MAYTEYNMKNKSRIETCNIAFFSVLTAPCRLPFSVREFEDFLFQSPSLTFYIYYTIKFFLLQIAAIFIKNHLFYNKYQDLKKRKNSDFFAMLHLQPRLFQRTKIPFESAVSMWSGTLLRAGEGISLTRRSNGRPGVPQVERNREKPRSGGGGSGKIQL